MHACVRSSALEPEAAGGASADGGPGPDSVRPCMCLAVSSDDTVEINMVIALKVRIWSRPMWLTAGIPEGLSMFHTVFESCRLHLVSSA